MNVERHWIRTSVWGAITGLLYTLLFSYAELIKHFAHVTPGACVVGQGDTALYFHGIDAAACSARGGQIEAADWRLALIPVFIALLISFAHGAFTGLFWDAMGLRAATRPK